MIEASTDAKPRQFRLAVVLAWLAFAVGMASAAIDLASGDPLTPVGLAVAAGFAVFAAATTYYFSRARNWARIALLVLFVMNIMGAFVVPDLLRRAPLAAYLYLAELLFQVVGMVLAFTKPASGVFQKSSVGDDPAMRAILPVGRSGWAIASGYLALFSVLLFPAPFALVTGLLAIRDMRRHPEKYGMGRAVFGIVMGILGTIALVWIFFLGMSRRASYSLNWGLTLLT